MKITFDMNDAVVYIPSGTMMNLKSKLGWDDIVNELSVQMDNQIKAPSSISYRGEFNFDGLKEKLTIEFSKNNEHRKSYYTKMIEKNLKSFTILDTSQLNLQEVLPASITSVLSNYKVKEKMEKLAKLKTINN